MQGEKKRKKKEIKPICKLQIADYEQRNKKRKDKRYLSVNGFLTEKRKKKGDGKEKKKCSAVATRTQSANFSHDEPALTAPTYSYIG